MSNALINTFSGLTRLMVRSGRSTLTVRSDDTDGRLEVGRYVIHPIKMTTKSSQFHALRKRESSCDIRPYATAFREISKVKKSWKMSSCRALFRDLYIPVLKDVARTRPSPGAYAARRARFLV
jgi:hypothetical protein